MPFFDIEWSVTESINGPGEHDDGVRDGDQKIVANGKVQKEADSGDSIREELTQVLRKEFPPHSLGPTYDIERTYSIEINEVS